LVFPPAAVEERRRVGYVLPGGSGGVPIGRVLPESVEGVGFVLIGERSEFLLGISPVLLAGIDFPKLPEKVLRTRTLCKYVSIYWYTVWYTVSYICTRLFGRVGTYF
ncbi:MAG: hypothetical protein QMC36_00830, partial [Patescibacteria group bacterium]